MAFFKIFRRRTSADFFPILKEKTSMTKRVYWEVSKGRTENKVFKGLMKQTDKQTRNVFIEKYRKNEQKRKLKAK
jgi:hypothetical protein